MNISGSYYTNFFKQFALDIHIMSSSLSWYTQIIIYVGKHTMFQSVQGSRGKRAFNKHFLKIRKHKENRYQPMYLRAHMIDWMII